MTLKALIIEDYRAKYDEFRIVKFLGHYMIDISLLSVVNFRLANCLLHKGFTRTANIIMLITERVTFIRISPKAQIGPGLCINHGFGVIIGGDSILGRNCTIQQGVTIGGNFNKEKLNSYGGIQAYPVIGNYVHLAAGCAILGPVNIGDHVIIAANATITRDIPSYSLVIAGKPEAIKNIDLSNENHLKRYSTIIPDFEK